MLPSTAWEPTEEASVSTCRCQTPSHAASFAVGRHAVVAQTVRGTDVGLGAAAAARRAAAEAGGAMTMTVHAVEVVGPARVAATGTQASPAALGVQAAQAGDVPRDVLLVPLRVAAEASEPPRRRGEGSCPWPLRVGVGRDVPLPSRTLTLRRLAQVPPLEQRLGLPAEGGVAVARRSALLVQRPQPIAIEVGPSVQLRSHWRCMLRAPSCRISWSSVTWSCAFGIQVIELAAQLRGTQRRSICRPSGGCRGCREASRCCRSGDLYALVVLDVQEVGKLHGHQDLARGDGAAEVQHGGLSSQRRHFP
mmetsp:Transcript_93017/g.240359  ORF Transcript_93017/g.240359 Transcript_93017/m.240359 type:complete len:307 (+) Transcript_93017:679-1599(+)